MYQHAYSFFHFTAPLLKASLPTSAAVDKTSRRQDLFRQSSPGGNGGEKSQRMRASGGAERGESGDQ